jgi:soluble lytic murein transglycosylase-like protein
MSRSTILPALAALALGALAPKGASADVLQIDNGKAYWVSGRSASTASPSTVQAPTVIESPAFTQAVEAAGPKAWQPTVAMLAAKYNVSPALLEAVVWQESRWRTGATSRAGAHGLAQLMPGTARDLGVNIRDPNANLEGGTRYLRVQLDTFGGDVEKALAAYNAGPGRVASAGGVPKIPETQAYVAAIMARLADRVRR